MNHMLISCTQVEANTRPSLTWFATRCHTSLAKFSIPRTWPRSSYPPIKQLQSQLDTMGIPTDLSFASILKELLKAFHIVTDIFFGRQGCHIQSTHRTRGALILMQFHALLVVNCPVMSSIQTNTFFPPLLLHKTPNTIATLSSPSNQVTK